MIITCTSCKVGFAVAEAAIGTSGRKVKCSKCQNVWFATLPAESPLELTNLTLPNNSILQNGFNLPTISETTISNYLLILPLLLAATIIIICFILFPNKILNSNIINQDLLNNKFGIWNTEGVKLKDIHIREIEKEHKKLTLLSYKIANTSEQKRIMPIIKVKLLDQNNNLIKVHIPTNQKNILKPFHQYLIETSFEDLPKEVKNIELSIGNKLELILR